MSRYQDIQDLFGSVVRPVKELKGFKKVHFKSHEIKKIEFIIEADMLKFWNSDLKYVVEEEEFNVFVGGDSVNVLKEQFKYIE